MPIDYDQTTLEPPRTALLVGGPSAATELSGIFCVYCTSAPASNLDRGLAAAADAANAFWDDGFPVLTEPTALAHATGHLRDDDLGAFLDRLLAPVVFPAPLPLETETHEERDATNARLTRLARDKRLRARYADSLGALWSAMEPAWRLNSIAAITAGQRAWQARLDEGADVIDLLPERHLVRRDERYARMVRAAVSDGSLLLSPTTMGRHIIALPGLLSVSAPAGTEDPVVARRRAADAIAGRLRPLADPTRLTILAQLAAQPSSVSDLARTLHIAQPTASVHLRQLREAGLVSVVRDGSRTTYRVTTDAVPRLLADVTAQLGAQVGAS